MRPGCATATVGAMSTDPTSRPRAQRLHDGREVVAGLVNDGSVAEVAQAAVALARASKARVRFVQVLPSSMRPEDRCEVETTTFEVALRALHGRPRVEVGFEYPTGDPGPVLVERSREALALVVGTDQREMGADGGGVARFCEEHARCRVHVVGAAQEPPLASLPRE